VSVGDEGVVEWGWGRFICNHGNVSFWYMQNLEFLKLE